MRKSSDRPAKGQAGGWIHRLNEPIKASGQNDHPKPKLSSEDLTALSRQYFDAATIRRDVAQSAADLSVLAVTLGISRESLIRLNAGWDGSAWIYPMRDGARRIVGISRRFPDRKLCLAGSRLGLFLPDDLSADGHLLVCEGASDTAAALTLGYEAVGIPSAGQGFDYLTDLLRCHRHPRVTIIADRDEGTDLDSGDTTWPGIESGIRLAERIMGMTAVHFVLPPNVKDLRQWIARDEHDAIRAQIDGAPRVHAGWLNQAWQNVEQNRARRRLGAWGRRASALLSDIPDPDTRANFREQFEERVAICIVNGGLPEDEAQRIGYEQIHAALNATKGARERERHS